MVQYIVFILKSQSLVDALNSSRKISALHAVEPSQVSPEMSFIWIKVSEFSEDFKSAFIGWDVVNDGRKLVQACAFSS